MSLNQKVATANPRDNWITNEKIVERAHTIYTTGDVDGAIDDVSIGGADFVLRHEHITKMEVKTTVLRTVERRKE